MKTLSNAELQEAIEATARLVGDRNPNHYAILLVHLENLTDEQRKRATDELELEPMEPVMAGPDKYHMSGGYYGGAGAADGRVDFDARIRGQDGPEWVGWDGGWWPREIEGHDVELEYSNGERCRVIYPHGAVANSLGCATVRYRDWTAWEQRK